MVCRGCLTLFSSQGGNRRQKYLVCAHWSKRPCTRIWPWKPGYTGVETLGSLSTLIWRGLHRFMACTTPIDTVINVNPVNFGSKKQDNTVKPYRVFTTSTTGRHHAASKQCRGSKHLHTRCRWVVCFVSEPLASCVPPPYGYGCPGTRRISCLCDHTSMKPPNNFGIFGSSWL